jgi:hypothetical protein
MGFSDETAELWRFDTSTLGWEKVVNHVGPRGRNSHVMVSVGLDLWLHGGHTRNCDDGEALTRGHNVTLSPSAQQQVQTDGGHDVAVAMRERV